MNKERNLSKGEARHRRKVLSSARKDQGFKQEVREKSLTEEKSEAIVKKLQEDELTPEQKVILEVERIWLDFKIHKIDQQERQLQLNKLLNELEQKSPDIYKMLTVEETNGITKLVEIRNRIIPFVNIEGYHTKRRS